MRSRTSLDLEKHSLPMLKKIEASVRQEKFQEIKEDLQALTPAYPRTMRRERLSEMRHALVKGWGQKHLTFEHKEILTQVFKDALPDEKCELLVVAVQANVSTRNQGLLNFMVIDLQCPLQFDPSATGAPQKFQDPFKNIEHYKIFKWLADKDLSNANQNDVQGRPIRSQNAESSEQGIDAVKYAAIVNENVKRNVMESIQKDLKKSKKQRLKIILTHIIAPTLFTAAATIAAVTFYSLPIFVTAFTALAFAVGAAKLIFKSTFWDHSSDIDLHKRNLEYVTHGIQIKTSDTDPRQTTAQSLDEQHVIWDDNPQNTAPAPALSQSPVTAGSVTDTIITGMHERTSLLQADHSISLSL